MPRLALIPFLVACAGCISIPFVGRHRPPAIEPALETIEALPDQPVHVAFATVHETAGIARVEEPVIFGVPVARGRLRAARGLELVDAGGSALEAAFRAASRWPDGSIRWLEVQALASAAARARARLEVRLAARPLAEPGLPRPLPAVRRVARPVRAWTDPDGRIHVDAGAVRFEADPAAGRLVERLAADLDADGRVGRDEEVSRAPGLDLFVKRARRGQEDAAQRLSLAGMGRAAGLRVEIEEAGPLRAVVRATGWHAAEDGARSAPFLLRVFAYSRKPWLLVQHTFIVSDSPYAWALSAVGVRVPVRPPGAAAAAADEELVQENATKPQYPDFAGFRPRYRLLSGGAPVGEGSGRNWLDLAAGDRGVCLAVRGMERCFPKRIAIDGEACAIEAHLATREAWEELLPPDARGAHGWVEFTRTEGHERYWTPDALSAAPPVDRTAVGAARTHELLLLPHGPAAAEEELAVRAAAFDAPLVVLPDPEELARSRVLGAFQVPSDGEGRLERGAARLAEWARLHAEEWFSWRGLWDEGGFQSVYGRKDGLDIGARWWNWHGRHGWSQDAGAWREGLCLQALRTGDARLWRLACAAIRHSLDVDTVHWTPGAEGPDAAEAEGLVGFSHRPGVTHWSGSARWAAGCTHPAAWLLYARVAGDRRALAAARLARKAFEGCALDQVRPADFEGPLSRAEAAAVRALAAFHADAPEERLGRRLEALVEELASRLRRATPEAEAWLLELAPALEDYYRTSGSEAAAELLVRGTRRVQRSAAYGRAGAAEPAGGRSAAYAWRLTGERVFLRRALAAEREGAVWRAGEGAGEVPRDLARETRVLAGLAQFPYLARALEEAGVETEPEAP